MFCMQLSAVLSDFGFAASENSSPTNCLCGRSRFNAKSIWTVAIAAAGAVVTVSAQTNCQTSIPLSIYRFSEMMSNRLKPREVKSNLNTVFGQYLFRFGIFRTYEMCDFMTRMEKCYLLTSKYDQKHKKPLYRTTETFSRQNEGNFESKLM